jgi:hypothetical protein
MLFNAGTSQQQGSSQEFPTMAVQVFFTIFTTPLHNTTVCRALHNSRAHIRIQV